MVQKWLIREVLRVWRCPVCRRVPFDPSDLGDEELGCLSFPIPIVPFGRGNMFWPVQRLDVVEGPRCRYELAWERAEWIREDRETIRGQGIFGTFERVEIDIGACEYGGLGLLGGREDVHDEVGGAGVSTFKCSA
jgi:hypothetical protein